jgi:hypothetical protein
VFNEDKMGNFELVGKLVASYKSLEVVKVASSSSLL